jgi:hypothetical protein
MTTPVCPLEKDQSQADTVRVGGGGIYPKAQRGLTFVADKLPSVNPSLQDEIALERRMTPGSNVDESRHEHGLSDSGAPDEIIWQDGVLEIGGIRFDQVDNANFAIDEQILGAPKSDRITGSPKCLLPVRAT